MTHMVAHSAFIGKDGNVKFFLWEKSNEGYEANAPAIKFLAQTCGELKRVTKADVETYLAFDPDLVLVHVLDIGVIELSLDKEPKMLPTFVPMDKL